MMKDVIIRKEAHSKLGNFHSIRFPHLERIGTAVLSHISVHSYLYSSHIESQALSAFGVLRLGVKTSNKAVVIIQVTKSGRVRSNGGAVHALQRPAGAADSSKDGSPPHLRLPECFDPFRRGCDIHIPSAHPTLFADDIRWGDMALSDFVVRRSGVVAGSQLKNNN
ncbi:hypothetical protein MTO96_019570 [Rhipicephalus appendiculatus]